MDEKMQGLTCSRVEVDELWGFIGKKNKNASTKGRCLGFGDVWTFLGIDPESKLISSFVVGKRDHYHATAFMEDWRAVLIGASSFPRTARPHTSMPSSVASGPMSITGRS